MDLHRSRLQWLCRLCGKTIEDNTKNWTSKWDIKQWIENCFIIELSRDDVNIHPAKACTACRMKLSRWYKKKRKTKEQVDSGIKLVQFQAHTHDCAICNDSPWELENIKFICETSGYMSWVKRGRCMAVIMEDFGSTAVKRVVFSESSWEIYICGKQISSPVEITGENIAKVLTAIKDASICTGNTGFVNVNKSYAEKGIRNVAGDIVARVELQYFDGRDFVRECTIRHKNCEMLLPNTETGTNLKLCTCCKEYRNNIMSTEARLRNLQAQEPSKFTRNDFLTKQQLTKKVKVLASEKKALLQKESVLRKNVQQLLQQQGIELTEGQSQNMEELVESSRESLEEVLPANSACRVLWEQQKKALGLSDKRRMRWHPALIRWAIAVNSKSASTYRLIRDSGFIMLPHPNTLYTYTHFTQPGIGINADLIMRLYTEWRVADFEEHQRYVSLIYDEMKVKEGLIYSRSSGKLVGFIDVGPINLEMDAFEKRCLTTQSDSTTSTKQSEDILATHVLVFMVRGLTSRLKFPVAFYPTKNITGVQLVPLIWKCIYALKLINLTVKCLISDGASSNRKVYQILSDKTEYKPEFFATNVYEASPKRLYFICDPPHLLKTTRNNMENSQWHRKSRNLIYNGNYIAWPQIVRLYEKDQGLQQGHRRATPGLRLLPKLRHEHVHLTPSLRMKVSLAAQVLSSSVANALEQSGEPGLSSTVEFIRKFDYFFDCLNVSSALGWQKKRKESLKPYTSIDDSRFKWLLEEFLGFLKKWEEEVAAVPGLKPVERQRMCLSRETLDGLRITVNSFVNITKEVLQLQGVTFFLSDKLNQDPVEEFFSKQRGAGGHHDNPTVEQFSHHMLDNIVAGSCARGSRRANVRVASEANVISEEPLPKKKRTQTTTK